MVEFSIGHEPSSTRDDKVKLDITGAQTGIILAKNTICGNCSRKMICTHDRFQSRCTCPRCAETFVHDIVVTEENNEEKK